MPSVSKSVDNKIFPYLKMKSEFWKNQKTYSYWAPQIQRRATMSNWSNVEYNI